LIDIQPHWLTVFIIGAAFSALFCLFAPGMLRRAGLGQRIREDGPESHLAKSGTPTAGGLVFGLVLLIVFISLKALWDGPALVVLGMALACGALGFADDYLKKKHAGSTGLKARHKLAVQLILGLALGYAAMRLNPGEGGVGLWLPFTDMRLGIGWLHLPLAVVFLTAVTNSVNFADGLDGLLGGLGTIVFIVTAFAIAALADMPFETIGLILAAALLGGICFGFLNSNRYPAKLFMGDTGSMLLGGGLAALYALSGLYLLLLITGFVFVLETLSVIVQVTVFKKTGRRPLLMAPLHHHFEKLGMGETRVVLMFCAAGLLCGVLGLLIVH